MSFMSTSAVSGAEAPVDAAGDRDELLACLEILARSHGEMITREGIMAGLPLEAGRLTPGLFARAAHRAGLSSKVVKQALIELKDELFPVILLLKQDRACVLVERAPGEQSFQVVFPELRDAPVKVAASQLNTIYAGHAIYARPRLRFDARSPEVTNSRHGHWFWRVISENRTLYRDVLFAAFLTNIFALAMPLFTMNVYDRVVPNQAFETLAVLSVGLLLVLVGDVVLKVMRGRFVDLASSRADVKLSAYIMERVLGIRMEQRPVSAGSFAANLRSFESVRDFIGSSTVVAFIDLPFAMIFFVVIGWIAWPMLLPLLIGTMAMLLYAPWPGRYRHRRACPAAQWTSRRRRCGSTQKLTKPHRTFGGTGCRPGQLERQITTLQLEMNASIGRWCGHRQGRWHG